MTYREKIICLVTVAALISACIIPMSLNPNWTGKNIRHQNQYQELADAFFKGQIYLDTPVDPHLATMANPYDPRARADLNLDFEWDHAFYKGRYYVYFGAVPALLIFAPYKAIVGKSLAAYHATQIFTAIFIIGLFALLFLFRKIFFLRMSFGIYLTLSFVLSLISVEYCIEAPALYCTAISSGLCMEVWSLYFFSRAALCNDSRRKFLATIFLGALLGSLAFECKPTVALANFLILPLLPKFLVKFDYRKAFIVFIMPYLITGLLVMTYNYLRFDSPLEFGQSYQLTVSDQHSYRKISERFNFSAQVDGMLQNFLGIENLSQKIENKPSGIHYLIFLTPIFLLKKNLRAALKKHKLIGFVIALMLTPILITAVQIQWTPFLIERYRLEIYWILALLSFIAIGFLCENISPDKKKLFGFGVGILSAVTIFQCLYLFFIPNDFNLAATFPELRPTIFKIFDSGF